ncbi:DNA excision repair protein ERCC-8-like [Neocloeon triangulifer]|uniref:DNA excision repair protein ERCC-8-like n=1 Tax=Neocloeon triangulifer TaxID=2078957 RepID=UPI00286EE84E|nr:DNA excision repair protein ERCC-8-like [Neocloeon triangulifer]
MFRDRLNTELGLLSLGSFRKSVSDRFAADFKLSRETQFPRNHNGAVFCLDIDNTYGQYVLAASASSTIRIHNITRPGLDNFDDAPSNSEKLHFSHEGVSCVQWYPNSIKVMSSSGRDGCLRLWDICKKVSVVTVKPCSSRQPKIGQHHQSAPSKVPLIAVASTDSSIPILDMRYGNTPMRLNNTRGPVSCVQWSPIDEKAIASASDGIVLLWDVRVPSKPQLQMDMSNSVNPATSCVSHLGFINGLEFTRDGLTLISYGVDCAVRMWDTLKGRLLDVNCGYVENRARNALRMAVNRGSRIFIPARHKISVFDLDSGEKVASLRGHMADVYCVRYNPVFEMVHSGGRDRNVLNWSLNRFKKRCSNAKEDSDEES